MPGKRLLKLNLLYQSLGRVFRSQKCVVLTSVNSSLVDFSTWGIQPYFPNVLITNGPALCSNCAAASPERWGLGASITPWGKELGDRDTPVQ